MKIVAMIPARIGSERLKYKNLRLLGEKPVISYVIKAAQQSKIFNNIVINSDEQLFGEIADRHNVEFYLRPKFLGSSKTQSDEVVFDFLKHHNCDLLVWVNPIAPLQTGTEIGKAVNFMIKNKFDTVITSKKEQFHTFFEDKPLNFNLNEKFAKTQDLKPTISLVYSLMMWKSKTFLKQYTSKGYGMLSGNLGLFEVDPKSTIKLNYEEDLQLCEAILNISNVQSKKYDKLLKKYINKNEE